MGPGSQFTECLGAYSPNLVKIHVAISWKNNYHFRLQFCTCHNSLAVMTCANLWPEWIITIIIKAKITFTKLYSWSHKPLVKWVLTTEKIHLRSSSIYWALNKMDSVFQLTFSNAFYWKKIWIQRYPTWLIPWHWRHHDCPSASEATLMNIGKYIMWIYYGLIITTKWSTTKLYTYGMGYTVYWEIGLLID